MEVSRKEAGDSLRHVQETAARTRKMIACAGADVLFIMWGLIWVAGFLSLHFVQWYGGLVWAVLVPAGIIASVIVSRRYMPVRSPVDARIGVFWFLLFGYATLWLMMLFPFVEIHGREESLRFWKHLGVISATVPMFAYVVSGLWLSHFMFWIGLGVTALTLLGLAISGPYFWVWMAATGGGTLVGTGLVVRTRWR